MFSQLQYFIKNKLVDFIENTCRREEFPHLPCNAKRAFFASIQNISSLSTCKVTEVLVYLLDYLYIRFGSKLYRENVGIPVALIAAHCFLSFSILIRSLLQRQNV